MHYVFIFYWIIALFILLNKNRTKFSDWAACTFFLYGFGVLSLIFREQADKGNLSWMFPAVAASIGMLWGPYALLMAALHYTGKVPKDNRKQIITAILVALPLIVFYFAVPALKMFGHAEPQAAQDVHTRIMTIMLAPYYIGAAYLLWVELLHGSDFTNRTENITTFFVAVPPTLAYYLFAYILPCLGYLNGWKAGPAILLFVCVLFVIFVVHKNVFGLSFNEQSISQKRMQTTIIEGTSVLQSVVKDSLLNTEIVLQNALMHYLNNGHDMALVMKDIENGLDSCEQTLAILETIHHKINPVVLDPKICSLLPIINEVIKQCQRELENKHVQIIRDYESNPRIFCDPGLIKDAILNLVNNAIEALNEDDIGLIVISVKQSKNKAMIRIRDNGAGINKNQAKHLGIPFFTSRDKDSHLGLGLYCVQKIINLHAGDFMIKRNPAQGIIAEIILPSIR